METGANPNEPRCGDAPKLRSASPRRRGMIVAGVIAISITFAAALWSWKQAGHANQSTALPVPGAELPSVASGQETGTEESARPANTTTEGTHSETPPLALPKVTAATSLPPPALGAETDPGPLLTNEAAVSSVPTNPPAAPEGSDKRDLSTNGKPPQGPATPPPVSKPDPLMIAQSLPGSTIPSSPRYNKPPYQSSADFAKYAMKLRESAIRRLEPQVVVPTPARMLNVSGRYPWKTGIVTSTFWIGKPTGGKKSRHNVSSSWDVDWMQNFGGYDNPDPEARHNFVPVGFVPRQNPFYVALPYNDVDRGTTKPESKVVIPWFREAFVQEGQSVCRDRWIAVRNSGGKVCYAQWSDCGPGRTDHWQYVFGNEKPIAEAKKENSPAAGLNISPAVRDFLGIEGTGVTDWKFVDFREVPKGPWSLYGDNNHFVQAARSGVERGGAPPVPVRISPPAEGPTIVTRKVMPSAGATDLPVPGTPSPTTPVPSAKSDHLP